jgi:hypothetical protein
MGCTVLDLGLNYVLTMGIYTQLLISLRWLPCPPSNEMKYIILYLVLILTLTNCSQKRNVLDGTYRAFYYDTEWNLDISGDKFIYLSSGHLGTERPVSGTYRIVGDTIILLTDSLFYHNKFLIDGDSCLIEVEMQTDYCINRTDEGGWGTRWRDINYPQIETSNTATRERVLWMLETALNGDEILEYFPDTTKSIIVQEYFELNKKADLNLRSHGTEITFMTADEIKEAQVEEYLIIDDVRLSVQTGKVDFQVMPEFSTSILEFFEKVNGQWTHLKN